MLGAALAVVPCAGLAFADEKKEEAAPAAEGTLQIFAANSLEKALPEVQKLYTEQTGVEFADTQFKASGDLVEQLKGGAVVDLLITASKGTMDKAEEGKLIDADTRIKMFNNDLVVVAAEGADVKVAAVEDVAADDIASIAIGDPATVPAGKYTCQALYAAGLYSAEEGVDGEFAEEIKDKVMLADKVGTCASYVSTGDATIGFVYSSDVYRYDGIEAIFTVPADMHKDIVYPGAVCTDAPNAEAAKAFLDFCMTDPDALDIWSEYGFEVVVADEAADAAPADAAAGALKDGSYTAEGKGIGGKVPVTVEVKDGKIATVTVGDNSETQGIGSKAIEQLPDAIVAANGTEGVDAVSGATVTSKAIFTAVEDCLEQAGTTNAAPEAAAPSSSSSNRTSSATDSSDHLGTLHFGGLTVTIPDGYECDGLEHETLDGLDITHGFYTSESSSSALFVMYVESDELANTIKSSDDGAKTILAVAMASLGDSFSHWEALDGSEIGAAGDVYVGAYSARLDGSDISLVVGGALDSEKRILITVGVPMTESGVTEIINTVYGIEGGVIPSSSSAGSGRTSNSSTSPDRSSYTPTRAEQNALNRANDYLEFMSFSRSGLIDQLEFEGFTTSEAEYAVDHCGADWDYQAVLKAKEYLDFMSFSRSGLIDQLEFEGFSYSQASAAATAVGL